MEPELQRIVDRILQGARIEAEAIVNEARKSANILLENTRLRAHQKATEEGNSFLERAKRDAETIRGRVITDTKKEGNWMVLSEKERLVTGVLEGAKKKLRDLAKSKKHIPVLEKMIVDAGVVLGGGNLEVVLYKEDSSLPLKIGRLAEVISEKTGKKTELKIFKDKTETLGGVIVKTAEGKIIVDNTFEGMLRRREKEMRLKIARILFSN